MAPDYEHLTLMQKVEVFEHALEHTQGDDLAKLLWLKSPSSEVSKITTNLPTHPRISVERVEVKDIKIQFLLHGICVFHDSFNAMYCYHSYLCCLLVVLGVV